MSTLFLAGWVLDVSSSYPSYLPSFSEQPREACKPVLPVWWRFAGCSWPAREHHPIAFRVLFRFH